MKRICSLLITLALVLSMAACSGSGTSKAPETSAEPSAEVQTVGAEAPAVVRTVDELLAAIAPGASIRLAPGDFLLSSAADYGKESTYYTWESLGGEYQLVIQNVDGLTITGAGKGKTNLITEPRWANVLVLRDCQNVTLENMTLGHTEMVEPCEGGVLWVTGSTDTKLQGLGLFGCGTVGLNASASQGLDIRDCEIYDCSYSGIQLSWNQDVTIQNTSFHSLGEEHPVWTVFEVSGCDTVTVSGCSISGNYADGLVYVASSENVTFRQNQVIGNRVAQAAFSFTAPGVVLDDNVFDKNELRNWYQTGSEHALDGSGKEVLFDEPAAGNAAAAPGTAVPVSTGEQKQVRVTTADEFLSAIAPDTCITLDAELLDLSTAQSYQKAQEKFQKNKDDFLPTYTDDSLPYCYWVDNYDGPSLIITGVNNLTIQAQGEDRKAHTLSAVPRYADVLTFENSSAVTLSGFTAGHTIEPGACIGGVFHLRNCEDFLIENCGMFGCGTIGVNAESSRGIQVVNSEIYECSRYGVELYNCVDVAISGTLIRDIGNEDQGSLPFFKFSECENITLDGAPMDGNYVGN